MHTLSSARRTCMASASAVECTATVAMPSSLHARWMRSAISPRLAIRTLSNMAGQSVSDDWLSTADLRHRYSMMTSGSPNSTGWPFSNRIAVTLPACGAGIWFIVFMASMMSSVSPCADPRADLDECRRAGLGRAVGGADHRRFDGARMLGGIGCRPAAAGSGRQPEPPRRGAAACTADCDIAASARRAPSGPLFSISISLSRSR